MKGEHWRPNELSALIKGANHLKPVLKGRFKHATDGVMLKQLAWEELKGEKKIILNPHPILLNEIIHETNYMSLQDVV